MYVNFQTQFRLLSQEPWTSRSILFSLCLRPSLCLRLSVCLYMCTHTHTHTHTGMHTHRDVSLGENLAARQSS